MERGRKEARRVKTIRGNVERKYVLGWRGNRGQNWGNMP